MADVADTKFDVWSDLDQIEVTAQQGLTNKLDAFIPALRECCKASTQVAGLPAQLHGEEHLIVAAMLLKRVLNDLRGVWILCKTGYTSQTASVAASLFEHTLMLAAVVDEPAKAQAMYADPLDENRQCDATPLAKNAAEILQREALGRGETFSDLDYEKHWRLILQPYKWLCKVKHPTLSSIWHDKGATVTANSQFLIVPYPDYRSENLVVKAYLLRTSIFFCNQAAKRFALGRKCDTSAPDYETFLQTWLIAEEQSERALNSIAGNMPLPFDLRDTKFIQNYKALYSDK